MLNKIILLNVKMFVFAQIHFYLNCCLKLNFKIMNLDVDKLLLQSLSKI